MHNDPNMHTLLGTLVDRAVSMPYTYPQLLRRGYRRYRDEDGHWQTGPAITEDIGAAASLLLRCLCAADADGDWSSAALILDPAGPWSTKTRDEFFRLAPADQDWILDRLETTADRAAGCLQEEADDGGWTWLWSQPTFPSPGKVRPTITRPDLVAGTDWRTCTVIDLKITSRDELRKAVKSEHTRQFTSWVKSLRTLRFTPVLCTALIVSSVADRWEWVEVTPEQ